MRFRELIPIVLVPACSLVDALGDGTGNGLAFERSGGMTGGIPDDPVIADFNKDGHLDLVHTESGSPLFRPGNGEGFFTSPINSSVPGMFKRLRAGDFDGDGNLDLAGVSMNPPGLPGIAVLRGTGDGHFVAGPTLMATAPQAGQAVEVGRFGDDPRDDIAWTLHEGGPNPPGTFVLVRSDGTTLSQTASETFSSSQGICRAFLMRADPDDRVDLVTLDGAGVHVHPDTGGGVLGPRRDSATIPGNPFDLACAVGNLDDDPLPDLAAAMQTGGQSSGVDIVVITQAGGTFQERARIDQVGSRSVVIGDFDGDGRNDIAGLGVSDRREVRIIRQLVSGSFASPSNVSTTASTNSFAAGDLDEDGATDLVVMLANNSFEILLARP